MSTLRTGRIAGVFVAAFAIATAAAAGVLSLTLSSDPVPIHVRWKQGVSDAERADLERQFGLTEAEFREGTTYAYRLANTSTDNIRALVQHPRVDDTAELNRIRYRPRFSNDRQRRLMVFSVVGGGIISLIVMVTPATWKRFGLSSSDTI
jgi:hypothetical protein